MEAIAGKKRGTKGKYHEWITEDGLKQIRGWARDGLTDAEICQQMGINDKTIYEWINRFPEIGEALKKGRAPVIVDVEDTFYEKKLNGYFVEEEVSEITVHPDGSQTKHKRVYKRWIPADTTAIIFYLKCKKGRIYNDRLHLNIESEQADGKIEKLIEAVKDVK